MVVVSVEKERKAKANLFSFSLLPIASIHEFPEFLGNQTVICYLFLNPSGLADCVLRRNDNNTLHVKNKTISAFIFFPLLS